MTDKNLLMLFVRNPELGKVKTRLAASVGPETARNLMAASQYALVIGKPLTRHLTVRLEQQGTMKT